MLSQNPQTTTSGKFDNHESVIAHIVSIMQLMNAFSTLIERRHFHHSTGDNFGGLRRRPAGHVKEKVSKIF